MMKKRLLFANSISIFSLFCILAFLPLSKNSSADDFSSEKSDYGQMTDTRKNMLGGYDYYNNTNTMLGHSERNDSNGYDYFNEAGNKIGSIEQNEEGNYIMYNSHDSVVGRINTSPTGKFHYQSAFSQNITTIEVIPGEDIGSINFLEELEN